MTSMIFGKGCLSNNEVWWKGGEKNLIPTEEKEEEEEEKNTTAGPMLNAVYSNNLVTKESNRRVL